MFKRSFRRTFEEKVMSPTSKKKPKGQDEVPKIRFIPTESRECVQGVGTDTNVVCLNCLTTFPAMALDNDDAVPTVEYFNHCFECPQSTVGKCLPCLRFPFVMSIQS